MEEMDFDGVEYLDLVDFSALDEELEFKEFCSDIFFEPLAPERFDPQTLNNNKAIKAKRKAKAFDISGGSHSVDAGKRAKTSQSFAPLVGQQVEKDDIRIQYSQLFSDAFNNADKSAISDLLRAKCSQDVTVLYKYVGGANPFGPHFIEIFGIDAVAVFWDTLFMAVPDSLFTVHEHKLRVLPNNFSALVCRFSFQGTKIHRIDSLVEGSDDHVMVHTGPTASVASSSSNGSSSTSFGSSAHGGSIIGVDPYGNAQINATILPQQIPTLNYGIENPFQQVTAPAEGDQKKFGLGQSQAAQNMFVIGTLTYHINPIKQIYKIEFIFSTKM